MLYIVISLLSNLSVCFLSFLSVSLHFLSAVQLHIMLHINNYTRKNVLQEVKSERERAYESRLAHTLR